MSQAAEALAITGEDCNTLETWVSAHGTTQQIAFRAQLIVCAAERGFMNHSRHLDRTSYLCRFFTTNQRTAAHFAVITYQQRYQYLRAFSIIRAIITRSGVLTLPVCFVVVVTTVLQPKISRGVEKLSGNLLNEQINNTVTRLFTSYSNPAVTLFQTGSIGLFDGVLLRPGITLQDDRRYLLKLSQAE